MNKVSLFSVMCSMVLLLGSCGSNPGESNSSPAQVSNPATPSGEAIYKRTCVTCHQSNGEGLPNTFPPLAKSDYLSDREKAIMQVLKGSAGELVVNGKTYNSTMPAQQLSDDEVASVLTYVYGSFGNSGGTVTPTDVKGVRGKL